MSIPPSKSTSADGDGEEEERQQPAHNPCPPSDELFDISTTIDPSYVISLIRKLLPSNAKSTSRPHGLGVCDAPTEGSKREGIDGSSVTLSENGSLLSSNSGIQPMDTVKQFGELDGSEAGDDEFRHQDQYKGELVGEEAWEEYGCILWDLAATKAHAEFMVQNLILEVLLANLMVSQSARITEISIGIIGNLACHEISCRQIASTNGFIEVIVDQLFLDDTSCLVETCRLLTLCLQGSERVVWAEALKPQQILSHILWFAENSLNPQLIEKSVGLLLAVFESQQEVTHILLPSLMRLGLPNVLINLLAFEMSKLRGERMPERYPVLDIVLRAIEALSVIDDYSQEICLNRELFEQLKDLIKLPDKIEVASSCVTAAVLTANILSDAVDIALELSQDLVFLQGLLDIFPCASDDIEAQSALWSIVARLLVRVQERHMNSSSLHHYVSALVRKSNLIEDELFDHQLEDPKLNARPIALNSILSILSRWTALKDHVEENEFMEKNYANKEDVDRLLNYCHKYTKSCS